MNCPQCGSSGRTSVKETRTRADGRITRRRLCPDCRSYFSTVEMVSETGLHVAKSDGRVVPFDRDSLKRSIERAAVRPYKGEDLERLVDEVVAIVYSSARGGPIPSAEVGEAVLRVLRKFDPVSHIRFALVQSGRKDREDNRSGWAGIADVRNWLAEEYRDLQGYRHPGGLSLVVKRSGEWQNFDRKRMEKSIGVASKGRGSPEEVWQLAEDVATDVERALGDQPIVTTGQIAAEILRSLRRRSPIAYLRFASTAKGFNSPQSYEAEAFALRNWSPPE
jgi:transcriptional repressor NrdR